MADSQSSRVAIRLGGATNSDSTRNHRPSPASSLGKRHRTRAMHDEPDSEDEDTAEGRHEDITAYGPGGASKHGHKHKHRRQTSESPHRRPRRSSTSCHNDRKDRSEEEGHERNGHRQVDVPANEHELVQYGLRISSKAGKDNKERRDYAPPRRGEEGSDSERGKTKKTYRNPRTADEEAMEALLGDGPTKRRRDSGDLQDDYQSVPIEDFGASLLRGFGWDGKMKGRAVEPRKHGNLTGLGSKNAKEAEDLGAWEQKKPKSRRLDDYQREDEARRRRRDEWHGESSYKRERERERERERDRHRERR